MWLSVSKWTKNDAVVRCRFPAGSEPSDPDSHDGVGGLASQGVQSKVGCGEAVAAEPLPGCCLTFDETPR
jgi:hypothetical protein